MKRQINSVTLVPSFTRQSLKALSEWNYINEPVGISKDAFTVAGLLEQINTTADKSDYLWYSLRSVHRSINPLILCEGLPFASPTNYFDVPSI